MLAAVEAKRAAPVLAQRSQPRPPLRAAAGSAGETRNALRLAVAWRIVRAGEADSAMRLLHRILAMLSKMTGFAR